MAPRRSPQELALIAGFVRGLYELGAYATWKEFAEDARLSVPQLSEFQNGVAEPSGVNLVKLIRAAAQRSGVELPVAAAGRFPADRLEELQSDVSDLLLGQGEILDRIAELRREQAGQKRPSQTRKASSRRKAKS